MLSIHSINMESNTTQKQALPEMHHITNTKFALNKRNKRFTTYIYIYTYTHTHTHIGSHLHFIVQITTKLSKFKRPPFQSNSHQGESTLTTQKHLTLKNHHQISTANLPPNIHGNLISMFNIQCTKYHILILF